MKALRFLTATLAGLSVLGAAALPAWGQGPARPPLGTQGAPPVAATTSAAPASPGTRVAVIDLQEVFKQHSRFNAAMEDIKKDNEALAAQMRNQQKDLQAKVEALKDLKPGSPDYKQREEEIAHIDSQVRVQLQLRRKELREREAKLYFQAYNEVLGAVQEFSQRYGIDLVIRFSADTIDPANPESIMMGLNRHVVYQRDLNITNHVIHLIESRTPPPRQANGGEGRTAPVIPGPRPNNLR